MKTIIPATATALGLGVALATVAPAAHAFRTTAQATAVCQGALPAFETAIRKRPLAVQNEGETDAFVTCSLNNTGATGGVTRITSATVYLQNFNSSARTVSCTGVNASATAAPTPGYAVRSIPVPASSSASTALQFTTDDFPGGGIGFPGDTFNVSCLLQPGVGISGTVLVNNN